MHKHFSPFTLPCGARLKNRIIKSAMSDSLADGAGNPTAAQIRLYERWALGGAAAAIIGEAQVAPRHPEKPGNLALTAPADRRGFEELARRGAANGAQLWAQLGHAGAMTPPSLGAPKGPSKLDLPGLSCAELSREEIAALPDAYARAAALAEKFGFGGAQIHAGHGFLLSQFLSPLFNRRADEYGGGIVRRMRLLLEIVAAVRGAVGGGFVVAVKINSSDLLAGGLDEADALKVIGALDKTGLDIIDISGGTYFPGAKSSSDRTAGGPYFVEFARRARQVTTLPLMATGGFARQKDAKSAITSGAVDFVGMARALALSPSLPDIWRGGGEDTVFPVFASPPRGGITAWYTMRLTAIGEDRENGGADLDVEKALRDYEARDKKREAIWKAKFCD